MAPRVEGGKTYYTQEEAAVRLGVSQPAVSKAVAAGRLKAGKEGIEAGELMRYAFARPSGDPRILDPDVRALLVWLLGTDDFARLIEVREAKGGRRRTGDGRVWRDPVAYALAVWLEREMGGVVDFDPGAGGPLIGSAGRLHLAPWLALARNAAIGLKPEEVTAERIAQVLKLYWEVFGVGGLSAGVADGAAGRRSKTR